jgi:hypothetical protein
VDIRKFYLADERARAMQANWVNINPMTYYGNLGFRLWHGPW